MLSTGQSSNSNYAHVSTTTFVYDEINRVHERVEAVEGSQTRTFTMAYDPVGNLQAIVDPLGHKAFFTYDEIDRKTAVYEGYTSPTVFDRLSTFAYRSSAATKS